MINPTREHAMRRQQLVGSAHPPPKSLQINCDHWC